MRAITLSKVAYLLLGAGTSFSVNTDDHYNILIHSDFGSRSHVKYLFEISRSLSARGHKITYAALQENKHFTEGYNISVIELPGYPDYSKDLFEANNDVLSSPVPIDPMPRISRFYGKTFENLYKLLYPALEKVLDYM